MLDCKELDVYRISLEFAIIPIRKVLAPLSGYVF